MAMGGTAAKLEVLISARDEATKKLMGLTKAVEESAARMRKIGLGMMAIGTASSAAIGLSLRAVIAYNEELLRLSKITGMSIEDTQKWRYAITQSEGNFEALTQVFLKLNDVRGKALSGGKAQVKAFQDLGVSLTGTGNKAKTTTEILLELSDKLKTGKASEEGLANAMELIGIRGGRTLLPFLREGKERIVALMTEAERLGLISTAESQAIDALGDRISALTLPLMKLRASFATAVAPALERFADLVERVMNWFDRLSPSTKTFISNLALLGSALLVVAGAGLVFKGFLAGLAVFKWATLTSAFETFALKIMYMVNGLKAFSLAAVKAVGWAAAIYAVIEAEIRLINAGTSGIFKLMQAYETLRGRGKGQAATDYGEQSKKYWDLAISPKSQAWEEIFKPMVNTFVNAISSMAEAAEMPGDKLKKSLQSAGDEVDKQFGAGFGKSQFGVEGYVPALMGVSGGFTGTVKPGLNVLNFTIYADDRKVGEAVQTALNKTIH